MRIRTIERVWAVLAALLVVGTAVAPVQGQEGEAPALTAADVETFFDGLIPAYLEIERIPGASVAVVANGETLLAKGYGYADVERRIPVDGETTLFRPGSISKLFTWTAVMQLVEQGKLDLNADVNTYLTAFQIPATFPEPITLAHLMAHTPGFEDKGERLFVRTAEELVPLEEYLARQVPTRLWPPGRWSAYSNYGAALAGYIVQEVSGLPFEEYIEQNIFAPLGMTRSTFRQPLPPDLAPDMAQGYRLEGIEHVAGPFEHVMTGPAGGLSAPAADMAKFMLAHLQQGRLGDARILQEETARTMHEQSFTHDPRVSGIAHGFIESTIHGRHVIGHGGDTMYFHSQLALLPDQGAGVYVSFNSAAAGQKAIDVVGAFVGHYFPGEPEAVPEPAGSDLSAFAGSYAATRGNVSSPEKLLTLFSLLNIAPQTDGTVLVSLGTPAQVSMRTVETERNVLREINVPKSQFGDIVLRPGEDGGPPVAFVQNVPIQAFIRSPWYATTRLALPLLGALLALCLITLVGGPVAWWVSRRYGVSPKTRTRLAGWVLYVLGATVIAYVVALAFAFTNPEIVFGVPPTVQAVFMMGFVIAALAAAALVFAVLAWVRRDWGWVRRLHYTATALAAALFVWWIWYWRLIPFI